MAGTDSSILLSNIDKLHTTELGDIRIRRNLSLGKIDSVEWCKAQVASPNAVITRDGKNWYVEIGSCTITINAGNYCIITAHLM